MNWEKMNTPYGMAYEKMTIKPSAEDGERVKKKHAEEELWRDIRIAAQTNISLSELLDRVKIVYYLSEDINRGNIKT